jgi:hypothetical protein
MAITLLLRMFRLCPFHRKSGGSLLDLAPRETGDPTNHQRAARSRLVLVAGIIEPPRLTSMWSNSQVFQAQSIAASRAA